MAQTKHTTTGGSSFPSHNASNQEKESFDYGMKVAKAIHKQWTSNENNYSRFYSNRHKFHRLRLYAQADQSVQRYKDEFNITGDLSYLSLDFTPVPIVPKFVDIVVNGMADRGYTIKAEAIDPSSTNKKKTFKDTMIAEMEKKDELLAIQEASGVEVFENKVDELPENMEELELYMQMYYKQGIEVAAEKAIEYLFKSNEYDEIKQRVAHDLVTIGIGGAKHEFCPVEGVKIKYVDPADLVYSYTQSKYMDDCEYFGEIKTVAITEVKKMFPNLTDDEIDEIRKFGKSWYERDYITYNTEDYNDDVVDLLFFTYKTTEDQFYKIKDTNTGTEKVVFKKEDFASPEDKKKYERTYRKEKKIVDTLYEGISVFGYNQIMLKWEKATNLVRPGFDSPKVNFPYSFCQTKQYQGKIYSLVDRMIKYADAIQLQHLKIQQVVQRMTPPGVYIDADGLAEIDLGNGTTYNPTMAMNMYFQTGSILGRAITDEGDHNGARVPIQELPGSLGQQLGPLIQVYEWNLQQIRNVTGLNEARDGSQPDERALVGVQKLAAANSNTATRHVLDSSLYISKRIATGALTRLKDALEFHPRREDLKNALGSYSVDVLDSLSDMHLHEYGIFLEMGPDTEEQEQVRAMMNNALAKDLLKPEDVIDVESAPNYRIARQILKLKRQKRDNVEHQRQQENIDRQNQGLIQVAQQKAQAEAQMDSVKTENEMKLEQFKAQAAMAKLEREAVLEKEILVLKGEIESGMQSNKMLHEDNQNNKKNASQERSKSNASSSIGGKENTIDNQVLGGGYLGKQ